MRAPAFWHRPPGLTARLLSPLGALYAAGTARRLTRGGPGAKVGVPVICAGNLNAGGTGKTPTVIAILQMLSGMGVTAHVVSRGYGGSATEPTRVDERAHTPGQVGDEPLLMAAFAPVWVGPDRAATAGAAVAAGAQALVLDDGFQDPSLAKDLSLIVVDAARGFGNGLCIPAGPLREPLAAGLKRADMVVAVGDAPAQAAFDEAWGQRIALPLLRARLAPLQTGMDWAGGRFLAFAGIGHPEKFFATLRGLGADLIHAEPLSDHQPLTPALMARLGRDAAAHRAQLVTTEKDAVRLPADWRQKVLTLPVRMEFDAPETIKDALAALIRSRPGDT